MNLPCEVIMDLIPLCKDGVASAESCRLVGEHIATCKSCLKEYDSIEVLPALDTNILEEKQFLKKLRRNTFKLLAVLLMGGAILGVSMTFSSNVFYNFLLMPIVGLLAYFVFGKEFYIAPSIVFVLSIISNVIYGVLEERLGLTALVAAFTSMIVYSFIYAFLVLLGYCIAWLMHYAFGKQDKQIDYKIKSRSKYIWITIGLFMLIALGALFIKSFIIM